MSSRKKNASHEIADGTSSMRSMQVDTDLFHHDHQPSVAALRPVYDNSLNDIVNEINENQPVESCVDLENDQQMSDIDE